MKKIFFLFIIVLHTTCVVAQSSASEYDIKHIKLNYYDSTYRAFNFITKQEAEAVISKAAMLKDSTFRHSATLLSYSFNYVAVYKDSTSKGRIFFSYEQYKDVALAKDIYQSIKKENEKTTVAGAITDIGNEGYLIKDNLNYPFITIRKENKLFKFKLYYLTDKQSLEELMKVAKKTVINH